MYCIQVKTHFDAAHRLPNYPGPCCQVHGHRWEVWAQYKTDTLNELGMAIDMVLLKKQLKWATTDMDHDSLNKLLKQPTAENIARLIFERLKKRDYHQFLCAVKVVETPGCEVIYEPDKEKQSEDK